MLVQGAEAPYRDEHRKLLETAGECPKVVSCTCHRALRVARWASPVLGLASRGVSEFRRLRDG
eukprot:3929023-Alexandrium_andersonii.AAC.1